MYCIALLSNSGSMHDSHVKQGLTHVCEHSVLFHHMRKHRNRSPLMISGRTDFFSCSVLFSVPEKHVAREEDSMIEDMLSGAYLTEDSLESAKEEVIGECLKREAYDKKMERVASFVTDGAIVAMPTGKMSAVQSLTLRDVHRGNPFSRSNSLIYLEYNLGAVNHFLYMPASKSISTVNKHAPSIKILKTSDEGIRIYLAMPSCVTYKDILLRTMMESVIRQRAKKARTQIKGLYHKHYFKEFPHLVLVFRCTDLPSEESVIDLTTLLGYNLVTKSEFRHARSTILFDAQTAPAPDVFKDLQCYLSFGTPSISRLDCKEISSLVATISADDLSEYIGRSFANVHIVYGAQDYDL